MKPDKFLVFWMQITQNIGMSQPVSDSEILSRFQQGLLLDSNHFVTEGPETVAMLKFLDRAVDESLDTSNLYVRILLIPKEKSNGR